MKNVWVGCFIIRRTVDAGHGNTFLIRDIVNGEGIASFSWDAYNDRMTHQVYGWRRQGIGITPNEYFEKVSRQEGRCAICGGLPGENALNVDHDHRTGRVRGLLCTQCNRTLERLEKFTGWAVKAAAYLKEWNNGEG